MKKIKKLIVALLAMTMVIGCLAVQASAADPVTKEVIFVLSDKDSADEVIVQVSSNVATCSMENKKIPGWGDSDYGYVTTSLGNGKFKLILSVTDTVSKEPNNYCSLKFVPVKDGAVTKGQNIYAQDFAEKYNAANTVYISIDSSKGAWSDGASVLDITTTDPTTEVVTAADCIALIDAIGTVEYTAESKAKIDAANVKLEKFKGDKAEITNLSKLTEAETAWDKLVAAGAGTIKLYVNAPDAWAKVYVHSFGKGIYSGTVSGEPGWPGKEMTAEANNKGWYTTELTANGYTNMLFTADDTGNSKTADIEKVGAGTYWYTIAEDGSFTVSTKAPEGWSTGAVVTPPAGDDANKDDANKDDANKDDKPAADNKPEISDNSVTQEEINAMKDSVKVEGTTEKLVVSPIAKDAADLKVVAAATSKELKGVKYVVADLKFESGKQPTTGTKITIDVTKMADVKAAKYVAIYSVKDAKLELVDTVEVKDGKITFAPKHFSTYVFAEAAAPTANPDGGVVNTAVIVSAVVMLAAATVIVASKKRVTE